MSSKGTRNLTKKNLNRALLAIKEGKTQSLLFKYLFSYILKGDFEGVQRILDMDSFNPFQTLRVDGENMMHAAAQGEGGARMCEIVYNSGGAAILNNRSKAGLTPLHEALHFDYSCSDVDREIAIWFLENGALLLPFPDITSIVDDIQMSKDAILKYMEEHEGAKRYEDNTNTEETNNMNDEENGENNVHSVGNSIFNGNTTENTDYEEPEFSVSLANLDKILKVAKDLEKRYVRKITFHFLQQTTLENNYAIHADLRMSVDEFKECIRLGFMRQGSEFDILIKQKGIPVKMEDEDPLSKYKIQDGTSVTIVIQLQSGFTAKSRKSKKRVYK